MVTLSKIHYMPGNPMEGMSDIYKKPHFNLMQSNPTHPLGRNQSPSPEKKNGNPKETPKNPIPTRRITTSPRDRPHYWCKRQQGPYCHPGLTPRHPVVSRTERKPHKAARGQKQAWAGTPPLSVVSAPGLVDNHGKCGPQRELPLAKSKRHPLCVRGSDAEAGNENTHALVRSCDNLSINYVLHQLDHNKPSAICKATRHIPQQNHRTAFL
jgi:hypothetical protein